MKHHALVFHLDRAGTSASLLCAAHCALLPLLVAFLQALALPPVESALLFVSVTLAVMCHSLGFRIHRSWIHLAAVIGGLALIAASRFEFALGNESLSIGGACLIALSHAFNSRLCAACPECAQDHDESQSSASEEAR
jgi:hypothetical protein